MMPDSKKSSDSKNRNRGRGTADGFTLIEMIVVMALLGIMLLFSLPRLHQTLFLDNTKKSSRWIIGKVQNLKEKAIQNRRQYILHIDLDTDRLWETDESMSSESIEMAALDAHALPGDMQIIDVDFPLRGKVISGRADIHFYKTGYTDKALIHIQDDDLQLSFLIEPFLTKVQYFDRYITFDD